MRHFTALLILVALSMATGRKVGGVEIGPFPEYAPTYESQEQRYDAELRQYERR
ncbi:MAG: hypothetical protein ACOC7K_01915 [bacterium]